MSILLIDDNPMNNYGYIDKLEKYYDVTVAVRLVSALRLIESRHFDIIIIDVMMPTQFLKSHNEAATGFEFYSERILPILNDQDSKPLILFWSRFGRTSFDEYFGDNKPDNVFFLHKNDDIDHLLKKIKLLLG